MARLFRGLLGMLALALFVGCGGDTAAPPTTSNDSPAESQNGDGADHGHDHDDGEDHDHDHADGDDHAAHGPADEVQVTLAKLSVEDRKLAETQKTCPVGGGALGSMGVPPKVDIDGREVFVCCEGCIEELKENSDKYLAQLDGANTEN